MAKISKWCGAFHVSSIQAALMHKISTGTLVVVADGTRADLFQMPSNKTHFA